VIHNPLRPISLTEVNGTPVAAINKIRGHNYFWFYLSFKYHRTRIAICYPKAEVLLETLRHCVLLHFLHGPLLKLNAFSNLLGVRGLFRSLVAAFLAVAVRGNRGLRTAITRMLVFRRSTSALPAHWSPLARCAFYTRLLHENDLLSSPRRPCGWARARAERECPREVS
jgi:hypothetical protein